MCHENFNGLPVDLFQGVEEIRGIFSISQQTFNGFEILNHFYIKNWKRIYDISYIPISRIQFKPIANSVFELVFVLDYCSVLYVCFPSPSVQLSSLNFILAKQLISFTRKPCRELRLPIPGVPIAAIASKCCML